MTDERASLNPRAIAPQLPQGGAPAPVPEAVAMPDADLVGQVLDGRYQVLQALGEGMLTRVYEARHSSSGRHFAIKVLRAQLAAKPQVLDRFLQQARAAAQIRHDNVVAIEEFGYTPTRSVYASVELVVADTLQTILDRDGRWSWSQARPVALQIAAALKAAHATGLVHRALKPANCFVVLDPKGKRDPFVKVADFGLAQVGVEANQASPDATTTTLYGDPEYMAPEQGFGGQVGPQSDIYAFGVVLYRMLAGQVPFSSSNPFQTISHHAQKPVPPLRDADPRIPEAVEQLVMTCLGKAPEQRFASAAQLEQALTAIPAHAQGGGAGHAQPPAAAQPPGNGPRFARFNAGGGAAPGGAGGPPKQPSVIVAGSLGDGGGGISGTIGGGEPAPYDPYAGPYGAPGAPQGPPPLPGPIVPPAPLGAPGPMGGSSATLAPPAMLTPPAGAGGAPSSFLASRPGLRMGLGAAVPSSDGPAPPPTIAPGMAMPSPTIAPGSSPFTFGADLGPPGYGPGLDASMAPPGAGPGYPPLASDPPGAVPGYPPLGAGPGMPPPLGAGPGMPPPLGAGPGIPPLGAGPGMPPLGAGPGMPPVGAGPGMPPLGAGPGMPPVGAGPGMPPPGAAPAYPPLGAGPGMPPLGQGRGIPPIGAGPGYPPMGAGPGIPPIGVGPGMPPRDDLGPGMPPRAGAMGAAGPGVGPGMPMRGMGPGIPPIDDGGPASGPQYGAAASLPDAAPGGLGAVEYDEEDKPKSRTWLYLVIGVAVILLGIGLALLIAGGDDDPEGDLAKVTRAQKAQDVPPEEAEPEAKPEEPEEPEVPVIEPVKPTKKPPTKKPGLTFEQSLVQMKGKIRGSCKKLGAGPVDIDTFVDRAGGKANTPKVEPKGPVGDCALRIVQSWDFPESEEDHPVDERVSW